MALAPAPAQDTNAVVVTRDAIRYLPNDISDLAGVASHMRFGGPLRPDRLYCLGGIEDTYDLDFADFLPLDAAADVRPWPAGTSTWRCCSPPTPDCSPTTWSC